MIRFLFTRMPLMNTSVRWVLQIQSHSYHLRSSLNEVAPPRRVGELKTVDPGVSASPALLAQRHAGLTDRGGGQQKDFILQGLKNFKRVE